MSDVQRLEAEIKRLRDIIDEWAGHYLGCASLIIPSPFKPDEWLPCDCGWAEVEATLKTEVRQWDSL